MGENPTDPDDEENGCHRGLSLGRHFWIKVALVVVFNAIALPWLLASSPLFDPKVVLFQLLDVMAFAVPTVVAVLLPDLLDGWTGGW